jgi:flagellar protein FliJ
VRRYAFRLAPVLRLRRCEEQAARGALAAATAAVAAQDRLVAERDAAYARSLSAAGPRACAAFLLEQSQRAAVGAALLAARDQLHRARRELEDARVGWAATAARVQALERLDDRRRAEHLALARKEDDLTTDELVTSRHGRTDR